MVNVKDHNIVKTKEEVKNCEDDVRTLSPTGWGSNVFPEGSVFLSLRGRKIVKFDFAGSTLKKEFPEIVLAPDGCVAVLERTRSTIIRPPE
jgi:hypothetical protein